MSLTDPSNRPLTVGEVAAYLRVSSVTVWRWCKSGKVPAFKVGHEWRIDPQWLRTLPPGLRPDEPPGQANE